MNEEKLERKIKLNKNLIFLCSSKNIKNFVIQKIAKYVHDNSLDKTLLVAIPEDLKTKGKFKKIEFKFTESYSQKNKISQNMKSQEKKKNLDLDIKTQKINEAVYGETITYISYKG